MKKLFLFLSLLTFTLNAQVIRMRWSTESKKVSDCEYDLIFKVKIDKHWHVYSVMQTDPAGPNATSFTFTPNKDYQLVGKVKEPKPHKEFDKQFEMDVLSHEGNVVFTQRIKLLSPDKITIKGKYEAQVCDSAECIFPPADEFKFEIQGSASCAGAVVATETTATGPTVTVDTAIAKTSSTEATNTTAVSEKEAVTAQQKPAEAKHSNLSLWAIFLAGFVGGFAALLTPCVFPMIPMNVSFFTKRSKNKAEGMKNALTYALFIIILYVGLGLGVTVIFGAGALHTLSTNVWFNLAFFVLLLVFAASFLGAFEIV
jgi:thiol:disulfide interchange protein